MTARGHGNRVVLIVIALGVLALNLPFLIGVLGS